MADKTKLWLSTLDHVPGLGDHLLESLGIITASGRTQGLKGADGTAQMAYERAEKQLVKAAEGMGANAVIGLRATLSEDGGGHTVLLIGNAVKMIRV